MSSETQEELERKLLQRVGILPKRTDILLKRTIFPSKESPYQSWLDFFSSFMRLSTFKEEKNPLVKRIEKLEKEVQELKKEKEIKRFPSKADLIYMEFKDELEKEHWGKIVAIDVESEKIVGVGNSILEAYYEAQKNTSKKQFSYRRVGFSFVHKL